MGGFERWRIRRIWCISFDLFWKDEDKDYIRIHNSDSLKDAMEPIRGPVFTLYASFTTKYAGGE